MPVFPSIKLKIFIFHTEYKLGIKHEIELTESINPIIEFWVYCKFIHFFSHTLQIKVSLVCEWRLLPQRIDSHVRWCIGHK